MDGGYTNHMCPTCDSLIVASPQGGAVASLSAVNEVDFDWPRRFWNSLSEQDQTNFIR